MGLAGQSSAQSSTAETSMEVRDFLNGIKTPVTLLAAVKSLPRPALQTLLETAKKSADLLTKPCVAQLVAPSTSDADKQALRALIALIIKRSPEGLDHEFPERGLFTRGNPALQQLAAHEEYDLFLSMIYALPTNILIRELNLNIFLPSGQHGHLLSFLNSKTCMLVCQKLAQATNNQFRPMRVAIYHNSDTQGIESLHSLVFFQHYFQPNYNYNYFSEPSATLFRQAFLFKYACLNATKNRPVPHAHAFYYAMEHDPLYLVDYTKNLSEAELDQIITQMYNTAPTDFSFADAKASPYYNKHDPLAHLIATRRGRKPGDETRLLDAIVRNPGLRQELETSQTRQLLVGLIQSEEQPLFQTIYAKLPHEMRTLLLPELLTPGVIAALEENLDDEAIRTLVLITDALCQLEHHAMIAALANDGGHFLQMLGNYPKTRVMADRLFNQCPRQLEENPILSPIVAAMPSDQETGLKNTAQRLFGTSQPALHRDFERRIDGFVRHPAIFLQLIIDDPFLAGRYMEIMRPEQLSAIIGNEVEAFIHEWIERVMTADPTSLPFVEYESGNSREQRDDILRWEVLFLFIKLSTNTKLFRDTLEITPIISSLQPSTSHHSTPQWLGAKIGYCALYGYGTELIGVWLKIRQMHERFHSALSAIMQATLPRQLIFKPETLALLQILFLTYKNNRADLPYSLLTRIPLQEFIKHSIEALSDQRLLANDMRGYHNLYWLLCKSLPHSAEALLSVLDSMEKLPAQDRALLESFVFNSNFYKPLDLLEEPRDLNIFRRLHDLFPERLQREKPALGLRLQLEKSASALQPGPMLAPPPPYSHPTGPAPTAPPPLLEYRPAGPEPTAPPPLPNCPIAEPEKDEEGEIARDQLLDAALQALSDHAPLREAPIDVYFEHRETDPPAVLPQIIYLTIIANTPPPQASEEVSALRTEVRSLTDAVSALTAALMKMQLEQRSDAATTRPFVPSLSNGKGPARPLPQDSDGAGPSRARYDD